MSSMSRTVASTPDLLAAVGDLAIRDISVQGILTGVPSFRLAPGQCIRGHGTGAEIVFQAGADGLILSADNEVSGLRLQADHDRRAILNDTSVPGLGRIRLADVTTTGQVQILARDQVRGGHVEVAGLDVVAADTRGRPELPEGFGVKVTQGAFTLWNMQADETITISARLSGLSAGRPGAPVLGGGIFVSGAGFKGGRLVVSSLETDEVHSNGMIAPGTADRITGGVFTVFSAYVDRVVNHAPVTTYGVNDMALDNWGTVGRWITEAKITTLGPSGIGFVNFGVVNELVVKALIETFGQGARGFNVYAGTLHLAEFERIVTHGDGAIGVQVSQPIGRLVIHRGIETFGLTGKSLVKGVVVTLSAIALSVKPGASIDAVKIGGGIITNGRGITPVELLGEIATLEVGGQIVGKGGGFDGI